MEKACCVELTKSALCLAASPADLAASPTAAQTGNVAPPATRQTGAPAAG